MKYIIKALDFDIDGMMIREVEALDVEFKNDFSIFSIKEIYGNIIKAQQDGILNLKWINEDLLQNLDNMEGINISETLIHLPDYHSLHDNVSAYPSIKIVIKPETNEEIDFVMDWLFHEAFGDSKYHNGIMQLPENHMFKETFTTMPVGSKYITSYAFSQRKPYPSNGFIEYFWVIKKDDLSKKHVDVQCPADLIKHAIGKAGFKIKQFKDELVACEFISENHYIQIHIHE